MHVCMQTCLQTLHAYLHTACHASSEKFTCWIRMQICMQHHAAIAVFLNWFNLIIKTKLIYISQYENLSQFIGALT